VSRVSRGPHLIAPESPGVRFFGGTAELLARAAALLCCHQPVWPGVVANPSQIVQGPSERTADFIPRS
jgi:hypothetical protein